MEVRNAIMTMNRMLGAQRMPPFGRPGPYDRGSDRFGMMPGGPMGFRGRGRGNIKSKTVRPLPLAIIRYMYIECPRTP